MKIVKAKPKDLDEYLNIREKNLREYYRKSRRKISLNHSELIKKIKKEFNNLIRIPKRFLFLAKENGQIIGFIIGTKLKNAFQSQGYVDDIYISEKFRRKGIASKLINYFILKMKLEGIKKFRLGVDIKNKPAINLYKNLGFKITQYEMERKK
jgi:ribosomal protein S18 acetylase RimI-like enzyme